MTDFRATAILSLSLHLTLLLLLCSAYSHTIIKNLPGLNGDLPFKLETGYVTVGRSDEQQLFYYFVESERDSENDPLVLSITGGPACSGFSTLIFEFGPITFDSSKYGHSLPSLVLNPYSWTKMASIIFLDWPVGAGFSYATTQRGYHASDSAAPKDIYCYLMTVNERGLLPHMSLQGYLVGSPGADYHATVNDRFVYAHNLGLISYEYLKRAETSCKGEYLNVDTTNLECQSALQLINKCLDGIDLFQILEPSCPEVVSGNDSIYIALPSSTSKPLCRCYITRLGKQSACEKSLGIREGTMGEWVRCNRSVALDIDVASSVEYHLLLAEKGYRSLVYNGDHDMAVPYFTSLKWIDSLNLSLDHNWRPWKANGQVAGFTLRYGGNESYLTFATIKGSGHTAPEYSPKECYSMVSRWLSHQPL